MGGSGDFAVSATASCIEAQLREGSDILHRKYTGSRFVAYFQAYTNTYGPVSYLREIYTAALILPEVAGISVATRPDCLGPEVLSLLAELKERFPGKFIWIELGLQTMHEHTAAFIRRGYPLPVFEEAMANLQALSLPVIVHVILGLPFETAEDMYATTRYLNAFSPFGIKFQLLHILKNTALGDMYTKGELPGFTVPSKEELETEDKWILSRLNDLTKEVCENLDRFELGVALAKLYDFVWSEFCDWYIELLKPRFADKGSRSNLVAQNVIAYVLGQTLKLLHPFMPFITEEIRSSLPPISGDEAESIMISAYPSYDPALSFPEDEERMEKLIELIRAIRNRRSEMNVPPSKKAKLYVVSDRKDLYGEKTTKFFLKLAYASEVEYPASHSDEGSVQIVAGSATAYIPLGELVDLEKEKARLKAEEEKTRGEIKRLEGKLSNEGFVSKAPAAVVEGERAKLEKYRLTLSQLEEALSKM